jgi:hypothetical protein
MSFVKKKHAKWINFESQMVRAFHNLLQVLQVEESDYVIYLQFLINQLFLLGIQAKIIDTFLFAAGYAYVKPIAFSNLE